MPATLSQPACGIGSESGVCKMRVRISSRIGLVLLIALPLIAGSVVAQEPVGTVVSVLGAIEVQAPDSEIWEHQEVGALVPSGASVRTKQESAARILFYDGSAVEMAASTEISIERIATVPSEKRYVSLLQLSGGRVHALVNQKYGVAGSRFEVETPTAVAAARGGEFIVRFDGDEETTTVLGLEQDVSVQGTIGLIGSGVTVGPQAYTTIPRGRLPSPPAPAGAQALITYRSGLTVLGTGDPDEGVGLGHPALTARVLRPEDLPPLAAGEAAAKAIVPRPTFPDSELPGETLAEHLSPDVRVHDQPIPEFEAARPGDRPIGGVQVDF